MPQCAIQSTFHFGSFLRLILLQTTTWISSLLTTALAKMPFVGMNFDNTKKLRECTTSDFCKTKMLANEKIDATKQILSRRKKMRGRDYFITHHLLTQLTALLPFVWYCTSQKGSIQIFETRRELFWACAI